MTTLLILLYIPSALVTAHVAHIGARKGYGFWPQAFLGLLLGPLGYFLVASPAGPGTHRA